MFGATKLNKLLFLSDFRAYAMLGESITGAEYQHLPQGPAPRRLLPVKKRLLDRGEAVERKATLFAAASMRPQQQVVPLREPDISIFSAKEIAIVDDVIAENKGKSGTQLSEETHAMDGWRLTVNGETIPYFTAVLPDAPPEVTDEMREHVRKLARKRRR